MSIQSRETLHEHFENGDIPNEQDYINVFDSFIHKNEDGISIVENNGNIFLGIGTHDPEQALHLFGNPNPGGGILGIKIENKTAHENDGWTFGQVNDPNAGQNTVDSRFTFISHLAPAQGGNKECLIIMPDGRIGIGEVNPNQKLHINGAITIGNSMGDDDSAIADGTIRYTIRNGSYDVEAKVNGQWLSLTTSGNSGTVTSVNTVMPDSNGDITLNSDNISDTGANHQFYTNARAIGSILDGYTAGTGVISGNDSILSAIQKLDGNKVGGALSGSTTGRVLYSAGSDSNGVNTTADFSYSASTLNLSRSSAGSTLIVANNSNSLGGAPAILVSDGLGGLGLGYSSTTPYIRATPSHGIVIQGGGYHGVYSYSPFTITSSLSVGYGDLAGAFVDIAPGQGNRPSLRIRKGTAPDTGSENEGDIWCDNNGINAFIGSHKALLSAWNANTNGSIYTSNASVGIGISSPVQKLELGGAIVVADIVSGSTPVSGTIRYSESATSGQPDIEVYINGRGWISLTASNDPLVTSVNGQAGTVELFTDDISDSGQTNKYFTENLVLGTKISAFDNAATANTLSTDDSITAAINKLNANVKTKIAGTLSTAAGLITYSSGTANTVTTNSNLSFTNSSYGGTASVGQLTIGSDNSSRNYVQAGKATLSLLSSNSSSKIEIVNDGSVLLTGEVGLNGKSYFGGNTAPSAYVDITGSTSDTAPLRLRSGTGLVSPRDGEIWYDGTDLKIAAGSPTVPATYLLTVWKSATGGVNYTGGKLGIGVSTPAEKIDASGAIKIGTAAGTAPGTIQYDGTDFKGMNGLGEWQSLTGVTSINGASGALTLTTSNISEGGGNYYFTNNKAMQATLVDPSNNANAYTASAGTVSKNDSIYTVVRKLDGNINAKTSSQWTTSGSNIYYNSGNTGIGTSTPSQKLHVTDSVDNGFTGFALQNTHSNANTQWNIGHLSSSNSNYDGNLSFYEFVSGSNNERITFKAGGKVGIGVTNPTEKLEVNGAIVVGNAAGTGEGTIFYHDGEFKGITGAGEVSLSGGGGGAVSSVNGQTGDVTLTTSNVGEGGSNYYFTDARATGATLSGYSTPSGGLVNSSDTIANAISKLDTSNAGKISSQWTTSSADIYFSGGNVGIGGTTVALSKRYVDDPFGGGHFDALSITNSKSDIINLFTTTALTAEDTNEIMFDPGMCDIINNMRTRIQELEARLQAIGLIG